MQARREDVDYEPALILNVPSRKKCNQANKINSLITIFKMLYDLATSKWEMHKLERRAQGRWNIHQIPMPSKKKSAPFLEAHIPKIGYYEERSSLSKEKRAAGIADF